MPKLPELPESPTVQAIYRVYEEREASETRRRYLGASQVGGACDRALWYSFRHCGGEKLDGRMLRLFAHGDVEEGRMVADLRAIGCDVHEVDPATGHQFRVSAIAGHLAGHMDGCALGIPEAPKSWHVLEFKTHNHKSFTELKANGVALAKPVHYAQMQVYMHLTGMERALYLAVNKDTEALYAERVRYDRKNAESILERAERIIRSAVPPQKLNDDPEYYLCRWCPHRALCHGAAPPSPAVPCTVSCRNCVHATPEMDTDHGRWSCAKHGKSLADAEQDAACVDHLLIPDLVTFAQVVDAGLSPDGDWTEYQTADGRTFRNGQSEHYYSSAERTRLPAPLVGAGTVEEVKQTFGATVEEVTVES